MKNKVIIDNIRIPVSCGDGDIISFAKKKLKQAGIEYDECSLHVHKKSVDARKRNDISFVCSAIADTNAEEISAENIRIKKVEEYMTTGEGAKNVSVLVMEPSTCDILALYNSHQFRCCGWT
mgnify:CR=1 FL=1